VTDPAVLAEIAHDHALAAPQIVPRAEDPTVLAVAPASVADQDHQWLPHQLEELEATAQHHRLEDIKVVKIAVLPEPVCWRTSRRAVSKTVAFMSATFLMT